MCNRLEAYLYAPIVWLRFYFYSLAMKRIIVAVLAGSLSLFVATAQAQTTLPASIEYSEEVTVEDGNPVALYQQALAWAEGKFPYTPKTDLQAKKESREVSLTGTSKIKMAAAKASGPEQEHAVRFTFLFRTTSQGYMYSVGNFRVVPDAKEPTITVALNEYIQLLSQARSNDRTRNDRRVAAQTNAVASDVASAFRSYMNSQPVLKDGAVGLPNDNDER
ncbi:hypothetical protein SAMN00120144_1870 [Hymenobacter roseosalivarius DSM 11622]|uniref:DUF4468 domain-containing protein n=2 Tax=Hymenobacter roseosalivarius TaxID=89967 RepID=A0A1W1VP23_9BACT|nr:hypothetical protein SAMN00120144_1870 [Hymenobacter roseosalivarius DSM 11622]